MNCSWVKGFLYSLVLEGIILNELLKFLLVFIIKFVGLMTVTILLNILYNNTSLACNWQCLN